MSADEFAAVARALRDQSDALNLEIHRDDVTEEQREALRALKRPIDAEAFELEQKVREIGIAADTANPDAKSVSVFAAPININGGGS